MPTTLVDQNSQSSSVGHCPQTGQYQRKPEGRVPRVTAAIVEAETNIVCVKHVDQSSILLAVP
jgi:hypothetical protein